MFQVFGNMGSKGSEQGDRTDVDPETDEYPNSYHEYPNPCYENEDPRHEYHDPLSVLPILMVNRILQFLDVGSLLQSRLVCQSWNTVIMTRNKMWKDRCRQEFHFYERKPETYYFHYYLASRRIFRQMAERQREAFQLERPSLLRNLLLPKRGANFWLSRRSPIPFATNIVSEHDGDLMALVTREHQLLVVNAKDNTIQWRRENCLISCYTLFNDLITAVTPSGHIRMFSTDGAFEHQLETGGQLMDATCINVHPSGRFFLAGLRNGQVWFVNNSKELFMVDCGRKHIFGVQFLSDKALSEGQVAICTVYNKSCISVAIISETGQVLHSERRTHFAFIFVQDRNLGTDEFVRIKHGNIEKYTVHCKPTGIKIEKVWQKTLPFPDTPRQPKLVLLASGRQFFIARDNEDLLIYRMDLGTVVSSFPGFFKTRSNKTSTIYFVEKKTMTSQLLEAVDRYYVGNRMPHDQTWIMIILINTKWLDGLSPSTVNPDVPIIVFMEKDQPGKRCLYWSARLRSVWADVENVAAWEENGDQDSPRPQPSGIWGSSTLFQQSLVEWQSCMS